MTVFWKRFRSAAVALALCLCAAGCGPTVEARKIEEIRGVYALAEYYSVEDGVRKSWLEGFDRFYLIVSGDAAVKIQYRQAGVKDTVSDESIYLATYQYGSTELIEEIKVRFTIPHPSYREGLEINYLTVSVSDTLASQKITYSESSSTDGPRIKRVIYVVFRKISADDSNFPSE